MMPIARGQHLRRRECDGGAMTDNEKAGTFIGWKPGQRCGGCNARMMEHGFDNIDAETGEPIGRSHAIEAPDMTDPRNYMKALLGLGAYEVIFQVFDGLQVCIYKQDYRSHLQNKPDGYGFDEEDWGLAAIDALVGIYDAEHKETA